VTTAVDTSAVVAVVRDQAGAPWLLDQMEATSSLVMTAANALEVTMVLEGRTDSALDGREVLARFDIRLAVVDEALALAAMAAWRRFGKGRHPAGLNFGDCFSYALAASRGVPLLCVGQDFKRTDLEVWAP
jgi:ribonuclease VapC